MSDPDARPIRKGKLRQPTEFGTVMQIAELCENTRRGARGLILPVATQIGSPNEPELVEHTGARLAALNLRPRELALDGGFQPARSSSTCRRRNERSSPAASRPAPRRPTAGSRSSASAAKAALATSSAATGCADPDSKATTEPARQGPGRSWPITSTRSPSEPPDTIIEGVLRPRRHTERPRLRPSAAVPLSPLSAAVYPGASS